MGLLLTFLLGIFILAGAFMARLGSSRKWMEQLSVSVAFGTMSALALAELLPEALAGFSGTRKIVALVFVALGVLLLKLLDRFIPDHDHGHGLSHDCTPENVVHIGVVSAVAISLHNMIEGMAVYSLSQESVRTGLMIALGVGLHNLPMGMIIHSTLRREKASRRAAVLMIASLSTFAGGLLMLLLWRVINEQVIAVLVSLTLGMILYIVIFELLVHLLHQEHKGLSLAGTVFGVILIVISGFLE